MVPKSGCVSKISIYWGYRVTLKIQSGMIEREQFELEIGPGCNSSN